MFDKHNDFGLFSWENHLDGIILEDCCWLVVSFFCYPVAIFFWATHSAVGQHQAVEHRWTGYWRISGGRTGYIDWQFCGGLLMFHWANSDWVRRFPRSHWLTIPMAKRGCWRGWRSQFPSSTMEKNTCLTCANTCEACGEKELSLILGNFWH